MYQYYVVYKAFTIHNEVIDGSCNIVANFKLTSVDGIESAKAEVRKGCQIEKERLIGIIITWFVLLEN